MTKNCVNKCLDDHRRLQLLMMRIMSGSKEQCYVWLSSLAEAQKGHFRLLPFTLNASAQADTCVPLCEECPVYTVLQHTEAQTSCHYAEANALLLPA